MLMRQRLGGGESAEHDFATGPAVDVDDDVGVVNDDAKSASLVADTSRGGSETG
jgi:hypothetical protein